MSLRDELNSSAASANDAALKKAADEAYERWTSEMKKAPRQKRWSFSEPKVGSAVVEVLKKRFKDEGYTVNFRPARTGGSVEIIDDQP